MCIVAAATGASRKRVIGLTQHVAAVRATFVDAELLAPDWLWVDCEDNGTIRGVVLTRVKECPFDNERWEHQKKA